MRREMVEPGGLADRRPDSLVRLEPFHAPVGKCALRNFGLAQDLDLRMARVFAKPRKQRIDCAPGSFDDLEEAVLREDQEPGEIVSGIVSCRGFDDPEHIVGSKDARCPAHIGYLQHPVHS